MRLAVARRNVERHGLNERIRLVQGDGLAAVAGERFDLLLCNPPYVNAASMAALPPEFRAEPELALAGGTDGMDFIRGLLRNAPACLNEGGVLVLEIGHERGFFEAAFPHARPGLAGNQQRPRHGAAADARTTCFDDPHEERHAAAWRKVVLHERHRRPATR